MIKTLIIKDLVLVEHAQIVFEEGLTIVTGETGAGKTALIEAIRLLLGERASASKVRKGKDKAIVQASFEIKSSPPFESLMESLGITREPGEDIIITREIAASGKNRCFIGKQLVSSSALQEIAPYLVDFIGQNAHISLKNEDRQRDWLDLYAGIDTLPFQSYWKNEKELQKALKNAQDQKRVAEQRQILLEQQILELKEANVGEKEDETLFEEYSLLSNSQEILSITRELVLETDQMLNRCNKSKSLVESIIKYDKSLSEPQEMLTEAHLQIDECCRFLQSFGSKMQSDPNRLNFLEERLKTINNLKKKYGKPPHLALIEFEEEILSIENIDKSIEKLETSYQAAKEKTTQEATKITTARKKGAKELSIALSNELRSLNIPDAELDIQINKATRGLSGEDTASFFLKANAGEKSAPVKESSSGGEISRLLFSLKLVLTKQLSTLIFDEIDANVGGQTATIMGEKLQKLGLKNQVICITHFPQVAQFADHHIQVSKEQNDGRTIGKIQSLSSDQKEAELLRMLGGKQLI